MSVGKGKRTHAAVLVDRTGSMGPIRDDAVGAVNLYVEETREALPKATFTLALFDLDYALDPDPVVQYIDRAVPIAEATPLDSENYHPRGSTPLLDAVGTFVSEIDVTAHKNVVVVIQTDGLENASREWNHERVRSLIAEREAIGWQFIFLAANQDAWELGASFGARNFVGITLSQSGDSYNRGMNLAAMSSARYVADGLQIGNEDERDEVSS